MMAMVPHAKLIAVILVAGCSGADGSYPDFSRLEEPDVTYSIYSAIAKIDDKAPGNQLPDATFLLTGMEHIGMCCHLTNAFDARLHLPDGQPVTTELFLEHTDDRTNFLQVVMPDKTLQDTSLIEPFFGRLRSHPMTAPRETCRVVSGVRDNTLRVGVLNHTIIVETGAGAIVPTRIDYDREDGSHCNMVALLIMHGFSEDEAQDYMPYVLEERGRDGELIPDYVAIHARAAELSEQGLGWPNWGKPKAREGKSD